MYKYHLQVEHRFLYSWFAYRGRIPLKSPVVEQGSNVDNQADPELHIPTTIVSVYSVERWLTLVPQKSTYK